MMKKGYIVLLFMCLYWSCSMSRTKNALLSDSLTVLEVKYKKLFPVLDNIIGHEKKCDYFDNDLIFYINLQFVENSNTFQIGSSNNNVIKTGNELGLFNYNGHLFLVSGRFLDKTLFFETNKRIPFTYYKPQNGYDLETNMVVVDTMEDDSFSFWVYNYENGQLVLKAEHTFCE